jgi:hypothetical protein
VSSKPTRRQPTAEENGRSALGKSRAAHGKVRLVAIKDIVIPPHRKPDPNMVRQLVVSIGDIGLLHPIILTPEGELVAGRNRIAAFVELGLTHIATLGKLERELAEIDENMMRRRPPLLDRGRLLAQRKELYEALHAETRQHVRGGHAKAAGAATEIFPLHRPSPPTPRPNWEPRSAPCRRRSASRRRFRPRPPSSYAAPRSKTRRCASWSSLACPVTSRAPSRACSSRDGRRA